MLQVTKHKDVFLKINKMHTPLSYTILENLLFLILEVLRHSSHNSHLLMYYTVYRIKLYFF
jgi:hypothetical protein